MKGLKKVLLLIGIIFCFQLSFSKEEDFSKIKLKDINGVEYSFGEINRGTYVKLWASWCPPCLHGLEGLNNLSAEDKNFEVVSVVFPEINGEKNKEKFKKWYKSLKYKNLKVLFDENGEILKRISLHAYPTSVILDKNAKVKKIVVGHMDNEKIKKIFE